MGVERNRALWISVAPVERRPGSICEEEVGFCRGVPVPTPVRPGSGSKGLPRPDRAQLSTDQASGVSAPCRGTPWKGDYLQSARRPSRLRFDDATPSWPDLIPAFTCPTLRPLLAVKMGHRVKPGDDDMDTADLLGLHR